jgi:hypothetical protein
MSETRKTIGFAVLAVVLAAVAIFTTPRRAVPEEFADRGEPFFPGFTDPNLATTLEVIEFDEATASARPFKVTFKNGLWTIPSHHDYPADGKDRLAQTAAGLIGLTKDDFRSSNVADYQACGVIDPLDETATSLRGRGKRVTIRDAEDRVLADLIIGKQVEDRPDYRFVRVPDQKRIYITRTRLEVSTRFADWIEPDLLQVDQGKIQKITVRDYSIDERFRTVEQRDTVVLTRRGDQWILNRMPAGQEVDVAKVNQMLRALDDLAIAGVRPKPPGISADLKRREGSVALTEANLLELQSRGYYFTVDGRLLSNEGEVECETSEGIRYTLRFGEVLFGRGEQVSAGTEGPSERESAEPNQAASGPAENRYLFLTASFDPGLVPASGEDGGRKAREEGRAKAAELNRRYADWYYVIPSSAFDQLRVKRSDLLRKPS